MSLQGWFFRVYSTKKHTSLWNLQTLQENTISKWAKIPKWPMLLSFLVLLVLLSNLASHSIFLSMIRNSHVAVFQAHVACRFYPLEGLRYRGCLFEGGTLCRGAYLIFHSCVTAVENQPITVEHSAYMFFLVPFSFIHSSKYRSSLSLAN